MALPAVTTSGSSPQRPVRPPGPQISVCVSSRTSSEPCSRVSARRASWKPGVGEHDTDVGESRLADDAGEVARGEGALEGGDVVEVDEADVAVRARGQPQIRRAQTAAAVRDEELVGVAGVVAGEEQDLVAPGGETRQAHRLDVGLGRRQRELPVRPPPAAGELLGHGGGVLGRLQELPAGRGARRDGAHDGLGVETAEGALVADVGVEEGVPVGTREARPVPLDDKHGRVVVVAHHPAHRDAVGHRGSGALEQGPAARVGAREARVLARLQGRHARGVDAALAQLRAPSGGRRCRRRRRRARRRRDPRRRPSRPRRACRPTARRCRRRRAPGRAGGRGRRSRPPAGDRA